MQHINNIKNEDRWIRPWNKTKHVDIYKREDRFFALVIKGVLAWLKKNILLYDKSINHFILSTGSAYLYIESNGYEYSLNEVTGEDAIYMERPRCVVEMGPISIDTEELSQPNIRGNYERLSSDNKIKGYNAEMRRCPITWQLNLHYVLSNFNEQVILMQEFIDNLLFQQYFNIVYLGQKIMCSIEMPDNFNINIGKIDFGSTDPNMNNFDITINVSTNYPAINEKTEIPSDVIIGSFEGAINLYRNEPDEITDRERQIVD